MYWMTFWVQLYCWSLIFAYLLGLSIAHILPILHENNKEKWDLWFTCYELTDGCIHTDSGKLGEDLEDDQSCKLNIPCVVTWHFMSVLGIIGQITICAIILRGWPHNLRNHIMLLALSNILMIAFYYSELTQV